MIKDLDTCQNTNTTTIRKKCQIGAQNKLKIQLDPAYYAYEEFIVARRKKKLFVVNRCSLYSNAHFRPVACNYFRSKESVIPGLLDVTDFMASGTQCAFKPLLLRPMI